jgi:hypothetical protein
MTTCDDLPTLLFLGQPLDDETTAHLAACRRCAAAAADARTVAARMAAAAPPEPPPTLTARVLHAATPVLAHRARRAVWMPLARAIAVALLPFPAIVVLDAYLLRGLYGLLTTVLPETLSFYLVLNYAGLLALVAALTYGTIPLLAAHQARLRHEVAHV